MKTENFQFKKKFGQNFLTDTNLLKAIVTDAGVTSEDNVLEIGAGAGALTNEIANATKGKIVSVEIDKTLEPILKENLKAHNNVEVVFGDILKLDPQEIAKKFDNKPFRVVANLPYYISTPIIFYLIESELAIKSITVMLQNELADRICAKPNSKDYGGISVVLGLYGEVRKTRDVPRQLFTPQPNVDSAVISLEINPQHAENIKEISKVVKACFAMRRKTLANNIMQGFGIDREKANQILLNCGLSPTARAETLEKEQYVCLFNELKKENIL